MATIPQHHWTAVHARILTEYFDALRDAGIKFFVLRNHSGLPETNPSKDVDLIIEPGTYALASERLLRVFQANGMEFYHVARFEKVRCWIGMSLARSLYIHIDLIEGYSNKGFEIISFGALYSNTVESNGFRVLNRHYDAAMLLLYKLIGTRQVPERYRPELREACESAGGGVGEALGDIIGTALGAALVRWIEEDDFCAVEAAATQVVRSARRHAFSRRPAQTCAGVVAFLAEKIDRIILHTSDYRKFIAFEAPDGAGKTTLIDEVVPMLAEAFVAGLEKVHVYHFRPGLLPNLGALGESVGVGAQDKNFTEPHRRGPAGPLSSLVRLLYYWFDYAVGYQVSGRRDLQFEHISLFDRYVYGFLIDPIRSRIELPEWLRAVVVRLSPQPDLVFLLFAKPETIHARKQELPLEEISRQLGVMSKLAITAPRFIPVDAEESPELMASQVLRHFVATYARRV